MILFLENSDRTQLNNSFGSIFRQVLSFNNKSALIINQYKTDFSSYILSLQDKIKQKKESYKILKRENELLKASNIQLDLQARKSKKSFQQFVNKLSQLNIQIKEARSNTALFIEQFQSKDIEVESTNPHKEQVNVNNCHSDFDKERELQKNNDYINMKLREEQLKMLNISGISSISSKIRENDIQLREILLKEITEQFQEQLISLKEHFNQAYMSTLREQGYNSSIRQITPISMLYIDRFFQGSIFQDKIHYKFRILQHLATLNNCRVLQTKLIYKMDQRSNTNFHVYIDNTPNMLCVAKTIAGVVIAGYYSGKYLNAVMTAPGLLISVTKNQSFVLKSNNRAMVYNPSFINFGNAEFRVKPDEVSISSNFGAASSYYEHRGKNIGVFLCAEDHREVEIEHFQVFQINYKTPNS